MKVPQLVGLEAVKAKKFSDKPGTPKREGRTVGNSTVRTYSTPKKKGARGRMQDARDARVKARLMEIYGGRCFFGDRGLECPDWCPDDRSMTEHMHIYGKHTNLGAAKTIRYNTGFSIIGCWQHHDLHHAGDLKIDANGNEAEGEVFRCFEAGDWYWEDYQAWEVIL
jgi:hypothetical protein